jgi:hypothetical protein
VCDKISQGRHKMYHSPLELYVKFIQLMLGGKWNQSGKTAHILLLYPPRYQVPDAGTGCDGTEVPL